jgi:TatD DNase family protein
VNRLQVIDSHCHLVFPEFEGRQAELRAAMVAAGVQGALVICTQMEEFDRVHAMAMAEDNYWASVGVHPDTEGLHEPDVNELVAHAKKPKVVGIGETGLDYYRLNGRSVDDVAWQRERFRVHIRAALQTGLPLIIHTRSASDDTLAILREEGQGKVRGVFHCFTETQAVADAALELGFHISMSGIVTFRNAADLRDVAKRVPLERLLIETDSPFLAPVPHRGKTNQPAYVAHVAECIAALRGVDVPTIAQATTDNFQRLFGVRLTAI